MSPPVRLGFGASRCRRPVAGALLAAAVALQGCGGPAPGAPEVELTVPDGAAFVHVVDTLVARGVVSRPLLFRAYAQFKGADRAVKSGRYRLVQGERWATVVQALTAGNVITVPVTIPEGLTLEPIAERIASVAAEDPDAVLGRLRAHDAVRVWNVPGPTMEGYLFPDTYRFAAGVSADQVIRTMVDRYRGVWTPERRRRLDEIDLDEREVVTLASIIEAEAMQADEMPTISAVYHNRLRIGYLLQADPTVLYALGGHRDRLLYAAIDSVADNPYNTYTQPGLPPGPIGAPGEAAIDAALNPAEVDFLYFVARPDGTHIFTRSLQEHNRARNLVRQLRREATSQP